MCQHFRNIRILLYISGDQEDEPFNERGGAREPRVPGDGVRVRRPVLRAAGRRRQRAGQRGRQDIHGPPLRLLPQAAAGERHPRH